MRNDTLSDAVFYAESTYLRVMLVCRILLASIAIILLTALHINRRKFVAHRSLTVLLNFHFVWVYMMCVCVVVDHLYTVYTLIYMVSPTDLINSDTTCLLRFVPHCIGIYGSICSLFMMSLERYTASNALDSYETSHKNYGHKLATVHIAMVILLTHGIVLTYGHESGETVYCTMTSPNGWLHNPICAILLTAIEIGTIVLFKYLLRKNEKRLKSAISFTLTERYQISENVRMIRILLPVVTSHVLITTAAVVIFFVVTYITGLSSRYYPLFEDSINLVFLQGICMPLFFLRQFRLEERRAHQVMATNSATGEAMTVLHRAVIQAAWNADYHSSTVNAAEEVIVINISGNSISSTS